MTQPLHTTQRCRPVWWWRARCTCSLSGATQAKVSFVSIAMVTSFVALEPVSQALCRRFAGALQALCRRCAGALQALCRRFAGALQALCRRFAGALQALCRRALHIARHTKYNQAHCGRIVTTQLPPIARFTARKTDALKLCDGTATQRQVHQCGIAV
jgi:hypothetical protein